MTLYQAYARTVNSAFELEDKGVKLDIYYPGGTIRKLKSNAKRIPESSWMMLKFKVPKPKHLDLVMTKAINLLDSGIIFDLEIIRRSRVIKWYITDEFSVVKSNLEHQNN